MTPHRRCALVGAVLALALGVVPSPGWAIEYKLQVVNVLDVAFRSFLKSGEYADGAAGAGLVDLESRVDHATVPRGTLLYDRPLQAVSGRAAQGFGAVAVRGEFKLGGTDDNLWNEVRWSGNPGEQSVWMIATTTTRFQQLERVALKGRGPLRHFFPYAPTNGHKLAAIKIQLGFVWGESERGTLWPKYLAPSLELGEGLGILVAVNDNPLFADHVYLIVVHGDQPTTYKSVLAWRRREGSDRGNLEGVGPAHVK